VGNSRYGGYGVTTALAAFKTLHAQAASPEKSPVIIEEKNEARDAFIPYGYNGCLLKYAWGLSALPTTRL
jgi:hypothetical protein